MWAAEGMHPWGRWQTLVCLQTPHSSAPLTSISPLNRPLPPRAVPQQLDAHLGEREMTVRQMLAAAVAQRGASVMPGTEKHQQLMATLQALSTQVCGWCVVGVALAGGG